MASDLLDQTPWVLSEQAPEYAKVVAGLRRPAGLRKFVMWKIDQSPHLKAALTTLATAGPREVVRPALEEKIGDLVAAVTPEEVVKWLEETESA